MATEIAAGVEMTQTRLPHQSDDLCFLPGADLEDSLPGRGQVAG